MLCQRLRFGDYPQTDGVSERVIDEISWGVYRAGGEKMDKSSALCVSKQGTCCPGKEQAKNAHGSTMRKDSGAHDREVGRACTGQTDQGAEGQWVHRTDRQTKVQRDSECTGQTDRSGCTPYPSSSPPDPAVSQQWIASPAAEPAEEG